VFQLINATNIRSGSASSFAIGLFSNRWLVAAGLVGVALQVAAINLPVLNGVFGTAPLNVTEWLLVFGVAGSVLLAEEIRKLFWPRLAD
jgi:Ca2+-transporting ATPase